MSKTIVYVLDDEPDLVEVLCETAKMSGLTAHGYTSANLFFEQAAGFETDSILVLDLHMPEMDGIEVMRRLAENPKRPALILVSGHDPGVLHSAEQLGLARDLDILASLGKPVKLDEFRQLLLQHASTNGAHAMHGNQAKFREFSTMELDLAIRQEQLVIYYEPQIEVATGRLDGVEALVRWQHPDLGLVPPDRFIPLAEQQGLMVKLTENVIRQVVQQEQHWQAEDFAIQVSVNISATDITSLTLPEQLAGLLADNKLDPTRLTLEITESALMGELVTSLDILTRLRLKGIGLSIDDFGTGYSSLSQLHRVPFTVLKIDRSFVSHMAEDNEARAIVKTCIILGHELNMRVVAEGVEDLKTWELLKDMGCDLLQGYYITRPMPGEQLLAWARARR